MAPAVATRATTVRLPLPVYDQAKRFVDCEQRNTTTVLSLNDFFVKAIQAYVKLYRRRQIDAAFAMMAEDADYQKEASLLEEEFEISDWDALRLGEDHLTDEESYLANAG
ncbi:MAG TPA: hypothetical protein VGE85_16965 [Terracidiphilus sp.]|jgi:hypothetical protein